MPDDLLRYADRWAALAADAFARFRHVDQPLLHLVKPEFAHKIEGITRRGEPLDSIASFYYAGRKK